MCGSARFQPCSGPLSLPCIDLSDVFEHDDCVEFDGVPSHHIFLKNECIEQIWTNPFKSWYSKVLLVVVHIPFTHSSNLSSILCLFVVHHTAFGLTAGAVGHSL